MTILTHELNLATYVNRKAANNMSDRHVLSKDQDYQAHLLTTLPTENSEIKMATLRNLRLRYLRLSLTVTRRVSRHTTSLSLTVTRKESRHTTSMISCLSQETWQISHPVYESHERFEP